MDAPRYTTRTHAIVAVGARGDRAPTRRQSREIRLQTSNFTTLRSRRGTATNLCRTRCCGAVRDSDAVRNFMPRTAARAVYGTLWSRQGRVGREKSGRKVRKWLGAAQTKIRRGAANCAPEYRRGSGAAGNYDTSAARLHALAIVAAVRFSRGSRGAAAIPAERGGYAGADPQTHPAAKARSRHLKRAFATSPRRRRILYMLGAEGVWWMLLVVARKTSISDLIRVPRAEQPGTSRPHQPLDRRR